MGIAGWQDRDRHDGRHKFSLECPLLSTLYYLVYLCGAVLFVGICLPVLLLTDNFYAVIGNHIVQCLRLLGFQLSVTAVMI